MKQYTFRTFKKLVEKNGFIFKRTSGDHYIFENSDGRHIAFNRNPNPCVCKRLIKENQLV